MPSLREPVEEVGKRLRLEGAAPGPIVYGERDGYLVQVELEVRGSIETVLERSAMAGPPRAGRRRWRPFVRPPR